MNQVFRNIILFTVLALCYPGTTFAKDDKPLVGISTIIEHPSLNDVVRGFKDAMTEKGFVDSKKVKYDYRNAQGSMDNAVQIAAGFVGKNANLILAVGTPVAKAAAEQTTKIPIVIAAITDPLGAGLVKDVKKPGVNITGSSDLLPVEEQFKFIKKLLPNVKRIGVVYNSGEPNSVSIINIARDAAKKLGLSIVEATANKPGEVKVAAASLVGKIDVMYLTTDNTTGAAIEVINDVCTDNKIPFISSEKESLKSGTLAFIGINYYERGKAAGYIAARILKGEKPGNIPISFPVKMDSAISKSAADKFSISIPKDLLKKVEIVK